MLNSEIDVSKCEFLIINNDKYLCRCIKSDLFGGIEFIENAKSVTCKDNPNCYYKQLQQLKQENEELKENLAMNKDAFNSICVEKYKLEQCLDEIEEVINK